MDNPSLLTRQVVRVGCWGTDPSEGARRAEIRRQFYLRMERRSARTSNIEGRPIASGHALDALCKEA